MPVIDWGEYSPYTDRAVSVFDWSGQKTWLGRYEGIVLNSCGDRPTAHLFLGTWTNGDFTLCGRQIKAGSNWLPIKHLSRFARPCAQCEKARIHQLNEEAPSEDRASLESRSRGLPGARLNEESVAP